MRALWTSDKHGFAPYVCVQPRYNLVMRAEFERELAPLCRELGIGVIPYSALASGFLTGKYRRDMAFAPPPTVRPAYRRTTSITHRGFAVLEAVDQVVATSGATAAQVALAWLLHQPSITAPIASATSPAQVGELVGAVELQLDAEALATLNSAGAWREA